MGTLSLNPCKPFEKGLTPNFAAENRVFRWENLNFVKYDTNTKKSGSFELDFTFLRSYEMRLRVRGVRFRQFQASRWAEAARRSMQARRRHKYALIR